MIMFFMLGWIFILYIINEIRIWWLYIEWGYKNNNIANKWFMVK
jgi:hypothetical protein